MTAFLNDLALKLEDIRKQGLYRALQPVDAPQSPHLQIEGRKYLNFSSNDYLGLANDPVLKEAAVQAVQRFGMGAGASRLVCGTLRPHLELEQVLADFKGAEAALGFSSGYAAAVGTITALLDKSDIVVIDKLAHACIIDAARLAGAQLRIFAHKDLNDLEHILQWANRRNAALTPVKPPHVLVVTESVFSMDGDFGLSPELVELKNRYGAWLMVDEAHATGLYGPHRRGLAEELQVADQVEIQMGTLSKAIGSVGGYICGARILIDLLVNRARSFIYSTALSPVTAAAATAAVQFIQSPEGEKRRNALWDNVKQVRHGLSCLPNMHPSLARAKDRSAIIPIQIGDEQEALKAAAELRARGIFIPAIRYPSVGRGAARLRLTVSASHTAEDIGQLLHTLEECVISPQH